MKKSPPVFIYLFILALWCSFSANAQKKEHKKIEGKDTTAIEDLDYHLTKTEFNDYYGTDDTSRAVIHLFYRKRGAAGISYCLIPGLSCTVGGAVIELGAVIATEDVLVALFGGNQVGGPFSEFVKLEIAGFAIIAIGVLVPTTIATINRIIYSRKKLLEVLVERERGIPLPVEIKEKLKGLRFLSLSCR